MNNKIEEILKKFDERSGLDVDKNRKIPRNNIWEEYTQMRDFLQQSLNSLLDEVESMAPKFKSISKEDNILNIVGDIYLSDVKHSHNNAIIEFLENIKKLR